jgi:hypothetical protein
MFIIDKNNTYKLDVSGIYYILNTIKDKWYIGSSFNINQRLSKHFSVLKGNRHKNPDLQKDFISDYQNMVCGVLYTCDTKDLLHYEYEFINKYDNLYNIINKYREIDINDIDQKYLYSKCTKDGIFGCWNLISRSKKGYGQCSINNKKYLAHRLSYFLNHPYDNQQQLICHSCNNKRCINPNHLYAGSFQENAKDNSETNLNFIYHNLIRNITYSNNMITRREILYLVNDYYDTSMSYDSFDNIINNKVSPNEDWKCPYILRDTEKLSNINWDIVHYIRCQTGKINEILQNVMKKYNITTTESTIRRIIKNKRWYDPNYIIQRQMAKLIR